MISDIYLIDGKYPDPYQIKNALKDLKQSNKSNEYKKALNEIQESGLHTHPLIQPFFVES